MENEASIHETEIADLKSKIEKLQKWPKWNMAESASDD
jgi:hypothetical protein